MLESSFVEPIEAPLDTREKGDAELVRRIAGQPPGCAENAEAELYKRLAPRVRLYGLRHLRDEQAAADLTQQVLLLTFEALRAGRVREPDKLVSFVLGTCRMVVLEIRRGGERRRQLLEQFARSQPVTTLPAAPDVDHELLAHCMQNLAERERSVLVLTFYDEQTSEEVAKFLGISITNVRVVRHRALGHLRECLLKRGEIS
jgi:RNA polymerase sigma-70 factor (ECF subfamily)